MACCICVLLIVRTVICLRKGALRSLCVCGCAATPAATPALTSSTGDPAANPQIQQPQPLSTTPSAAVDAAGQPLADSPSGSNPPSRSNTEDEEFFDAEEGDTATPRRRRLSSASSSSAASGAVTSVEDADANNAQLTATGVPPAAAALAASAAAAGQPVHAALQLLEGFGLDVDDASFIAAPSFVSAMTSFTAASGSAGWDTAGAAGSNSSSDPAKQELVRLRFAQYSPNSNNYTGLDVEVLLKLSTLVFYCNRPTVAALMVFGTDLGAINTLLSSQAGVQHVRQGIFDFFRSSHIGTWGYICIVSSMIDLCPCHLSSDDHLLSIATADAHFLLCWLRCCRRRLMEVMQPHLQRQLPLTVSLSVTFSWSGVGESNALCSS